MTVTGPGINFHEVRLITHTLSYSFIKALKMNPGMVTLTLTDELRPEYRKLGRVRHVWIRWNW